MTQIPPIAVTPGEPAGIGVDVLLQAAMRKLPSCVVAVADKNLLQSRTQQLNSAIQLFEVGLDELPQTHTPGTLPFIHVQAPTVPVCGQPDPANADYILQTLKIAVTGCLKQQFSALVTGPIHKASINAAGIAFSGHTEYLAELAQAPKTVMLLQTPGLRVALVTTHVPLKNVAAYITPENLNSTLRIIHADLIQRFGVSDPCLLVCGLNPHAGEGGYLGTEEQEVIIPVIQQLKQQGMNIMGPLAADTIFTPDNLRHADVIVAMYHDQGLPVLKYKGFAKAVNITLGLPIVRTSVDHGTALTLVGTGQTDPGSLLYAINTAYELVFHLSG